MRYFHIFMVNRFWLLISASLFMLSAFSYSVCGTETPETFVIQYLPGVTQKFKNYCEDAVKRGAPHTELRERFFVFAKEGESSAAHALWHCNKHKPLQELVVELRKFASEKNPYACNLLANCLANQRNPECLIWYQIYDLNFTGEDLDFRENYAAAILKLKQPLNVEALKDVWRLLRAWREIDKTKSDEALEGLYSALSKAAIKIKAKEFICDLCTWAITQKDNIIQRGINLPIQGTEFADIVFERTKLVPLVIDTRKNLSSIQKSVLEQAKGYLARYQNNRQTVAEAVSVNLAFLLQDVEVRNIPLNPNNSSYFIDFKEHEPTEMHLKSWAILIINNKDYRAKLIAVSDQGLALQDIAKRVKNVELLEHVVEGFKIIYGYKNQDAS